VREGQRASAETRANKERNRRIQEAFKAGETVKKIAPNHHVSYRRALQIIGPRKK
jgi:hypothetical protein